MPAFPQGGARSFLVRFFPRCHAGFSSGRRSLVPRSLLPSVMRRRAALVAVAAAVGLAATPTGAEPLPVPSVVVAGPAAFAAGFATPVVLVTQGQALQFLSVDAAPHNVRSRATTLKRVKVGNRWKTIRVRLFSSSTIDGAGVAEVVGVTALKPGSYAFVCSLHASMTGELQVQPSPV